jgi:hypothetical protein
VLSSSKTREPLCLGTNHCGAYIDAPAEGSRLPCTMYGTMLRVPVKAVWFALTNSLRYAWKKQPPKRSHRSRCSGHLNKATSSHLEKSDPPSQSFRSLPRPGSALSADCEFDSGVLLRDALGSFAQYMYFFGTFG